LARDQKSLATPDLDRLDLKVKNLFSFQKLIFGYFLFQEPVVDRRVFSQA